MERRLEAAGRGGARASLLILGPDGSVRAAVAGGAPLRDTPEARRAGSASLRHLGRDGRPVYDRVVAGPAPAAERRTRPAGAARRPRPSSRGRRRPGEPGRPVRRDDRRPPRRHDRVEQRGRERCRRRPEALFQDVAAQWAKAHPAPPAPEARETARETGSTARSFARPAWQNPGERTAPSLTGVPRVIDTGRLRLDGQAVRLAGVEGQGGSYAREFRQYLRRREVTCQPAGGPDLYRCRAGEQDLSEVVLFNGGRTRRTGRPAGIAGGGSERQGAQGGGCGSELGSRREGAKPSHPEIRRRHLPGCGRSPPPGPGGGCGRSRARRRNRRWRAPALAFCSTSRIVRPSGPQRGDDGKNLVDDEGGEAHRGLVQQQQHRLGQSARGPSPASAARRPTGSPPAGAAARRAAGTAPSTAAWRRAASGPGTW